jgi:molybdate transport system ATP-binding protein
MGEAAPLTEVPQGLALSVDVRQRFDSGFAVAAALDVSLTTGSIVVLFGPSGAGKTTMLRQIAGLERPNPGTIRFGSEVWCDTRRDIWRSPQQRRVGVVFQEPTLFPHLSVRENVEYALASQPRGARSARAAEVGALLGVDRLMSRPTRALSGGEARRVALARALAPRPRLFLLDEPFAALDAPTRSRLRRDVRSLLHRIGTPAVLVTHDRTEAMALGDMVAVMMGGRVRQVGPASDVFSRPVDAEVAASLGVEAVLPARIVESVSGLLAVAIGDVVLHVAERDPLAPGAEVFVCIRAEDVTLETRSSAHASTRNHLSSRVVAIAPEGPIDRVALDCGFPLDALITRRAREELNLAPGAQVTAAIKATSVHLVPRV